MRNELGISIRLAAAILGVFVMLQVAADGTNMQKAHSAMEIARSYKGQGDLRKAEHMFRVVMENSPAESNIHHEAKDELEYYMPLIRIQRLLWDGKVRAVEQELFALQQAFEDQPLRLQEINRILNGLQAAAADSKAQPDSKVDEKHVLREARMNLDNYYRQNNRYPTSRSTLADVLDFAASPLNAFEIERYSSNGLGYLLVLRKKEDKNQTITLQNTGLLQ